MRQTTASPGNDLERLRLEYANRSVRLSNRDIYSLFNPSYLFGIQQRQRVLLRLLKKYGRESLAEQKILEVGSGGGNVLRELLWYGARADRLFGFDLLEDRVGSCRKALPFLSTLCADAQFLPYRSHHFDLLLQSMVFSSILDPEIKANISREMLRVLKPDGMILWYDFWLNPTNPQTRGLRPAEIRRLFPGCRFEFQRITLAPPIARRLVPVSWLLCAFLEKVRIFNTHYLVAIRPA